MLNSEYLLDSFQAEGTDIEECKKLISELLDHTQFDKKNSCEMHILSYFTSGDDDEKLWFYHLNPDTLPTDTPALAIQYYAKRITKSSMRKKNVPDSLINEVPSVKTMLMYNDKPHFASRNAFATLDQFDLKGGFLSEPCLERDMIVAKQFKKERPCTFVIRNFGPDIKKVFAIMSGNYTPVSQTVLFNLIDKIDVDGILGRIVCKRWIVNHFFTEIDMEFPEKAEELKKTYGLTGSFVPGIRIMTSDTGDSAMRVYGTWRINNSLSIAQEVSRKHKGTFNLAEIMSDIDKNIFSEYVKLPEALCDLMSVNITPSGLDLADPKDKKRNFVAIEDTIKSIFSQIKMVKAIGKKNEIVIRQLLLEEIDTSVEYSAYDIAIQIMTTPERLTGLTEASIKALSKAVSEVPFCRFEESVVLV